ncbi:MAG: bifunctional 2-polyprenyl-6-hydroxyphenol methylase/3-demethylubiquinol 3-O-methyltransferase UbiG [Arsenophonus sp.]|nr:MAG: bifunctional 2-polyprenyl-6-hydroxyphenol methylase/3-demethylubiquinol 3-O-methyltransferase UbiG [Arsenophonus sp.]
MKNKIKNFDIKEIKQFEKIANHWWNKNNNVYLLHKLNPLRLNYILKHSNGLYKKKILDIGCGGGILSESISKEGGIVTGIDISKKQIEVAKKHALKKKYKINYLVETVEEHIKKKKKYDVITCMELLEHVPYPKSIIKSCQYLIKSSGDIFISTINRTIQSWFFIIFIGEYVLNYIPKGTHKIKKFIQPSELLEWIDNSSLIAKNITGIKYNPIIKNFQLSSNLNTNYLIHLKNQTF